MHQQQVAAASSSSGDGDGPARIPIGTKFLYGGLAGIGATLVVQPLDLVKNRMQMSQKVAGQKQYKSSFHALRSIITNEGPLAVYNGLSAGLLRQATYASIRFGIYTSLLEKYSSDGGQHPNFVSKLLIGSVAGGIASFAGTPTEVALVRMTSDGRLPLAERRNYTSVFNALFRVTKEEGLLTLWKGSAPTVARAIVSNATQLAVYSQAKEAILSTGYVHDGVACHFYASMVSGLVATATSLPLDAAKTRIQNMRVIDGRPEYRSVIDVLSKIIKNEGFYSLWKGFTPYYMRIGPHTVLSFILLEQLNKFYFRYVLGIEGDRPGAL